MFPIHSHRIFRSPREYFICHAPKTYLLNAYFFYLFNVYFLCFFSPYFSNIFYHTKLHFKKHVLNNFRLRQSSTRHSTLSVQNCVCYVLFPSVFCLATNSIGEFIFAALIRLLTGTNYYFYTGRLKYNMIMNEI